MADRVAVVIAGIASPTVSKYRWNEIAPHDIQNRANVPYKLNGLFLNAIIVNAPNNSPDPIPNIPYRGTP